MAKIKPKRTLIRSTNVNRTSKWSDSISFLAKNAATPKRKRKEIKGDEEEDEEEEEGDDDDDDDEERERERENLIRSASNGRDDVSDVGRNEKRRRQLDALRQPWNPIFCSFVFFCFFFLGFYFKSRQSRAKSSLVELSNRLVPIKPGKTQ